MAAQLGGPVLLKQGYLQIKKTFGWKRQYYRLLQVASAACRPAPAVTLALPRFRVRDLCLTTWRVMTPCNPPAVCPQDSLFSFDSHESKTPTDEIPLMGGEVKDASWEVKRANAVMIETDVGKKYYLVCDNTLEHQQWFDALYYGTTVSTLAEYCSPLSGGWLYFYEHKRWTRRWFMIRDSFLLCYNSREDVGPITVRPAARFSVLAYAEHVKLTINLTDADGRQCASKTICAAACRSGCGLPQDNETILFLAANYARRRAQARVRICGRE